MHELMCSIVSFLLSIVVVLSHDNSYRLPTDLKPLHYDLRILTHLNGPDNLAFEGKVKIDFQALHSTRFITLNVKNLTIDETDIHLSLRNGSRSYSINRIERNETLEFYTLQLSGELRSQEQYTLSIPFHAPLNVVEVGYYVDSYRDRKTNQTHYMAGTQFSPTRARLAYPCFDEPHLRATFRVTLGYHKNYTGLSNTPVSKCVDHDTLDNYVWCEHEPLLSTSTYLVAYAVHDLASLPVQYSDTHNNVSIRSWMTPDAIKNGNFTADFGPKVLSFLEKLLGFAYPLKKVDQMTLQRHIFIAMENWGLITFKESTFVENDGEIREIKDERVVSIAHEYAHQWFGNLVAINWWNDVWLKEGSSTYFAYLATDVLLPEWDVHQRTVANNLALFFSNDMYNDTIPISRDVQDSKSIIAHFTDYVYKKGSLMQRMQHKLLGDEVFMMGIRNYIQRHAYSSVRQSDLWQAMQEAADLKGHLAADIRLATVMDSWTLQKGYPLVTVIRNYSSNTVWIDQTRFTLAADNGEDTCWWIPLTFVTQRQGSFNETQPQLWLKCPNTGKTLRLPKEPSSTEWIMLNPQVNTIYRVNYDENNWRMIIKTLNSANFDSIHVLNRAQLLDDLLILASTRAQSYDLAFTLLEYLPRESEVLPWDRAISLLNDRGRLLSDEPESIFRTYMKKLMTSLYSRIPKLNSARLRTNSGSLIALYRFSYKESCRYGVSDCISQVKRLTQDVEHDNQVPPDLRDIVDCTSIELGNNLLIQSILKRFQNMSTFAQRSAWATALGCTRDFGQLQPFLDYLIQATDKATFNYYIQTVTSALERKHIAKEIADHIIQNAKVINSKFDLKDIKPLLNTIIGDLITDLEDNQLRQQLKGLDKFEAPLQAALDRRDINRYWLTERAEHFIKALSKYA